MSRRPAALSPCAVRLSFLRARRPVTRRAKACGRYPIDGGGHEFLGQRSEACHKQQKMHKLLAKPATGLFPELRRNTMLFFSEGFTFRNFLADAFAVFMFVLWFWLLIIVIGDLFRRHDISGWVKAIWVIALIVFPYLGIFAYLITQSRGMAERSSQQAAQAREELRRVVGFSAADEIEKLDRLKKSGSITDQEFARLRAKLVA